MLFALPMLLLVLGVCLIPVVLILWTSLGGDPITLQFYEKILSDRLYGTVLLTTLEISVTSVAATLLLAYPVAYHLARLPPRRRAVFAMLVLLPFYTSIVVKSFAFTVLLGENGLLNQALAMVTAGTVKVQFLFNRIGVLVGMTHYLLPFMVFPILASLLAQPPALKVAAEVMGASPYRVFWRVTFPLSLPGVATGCVMCMILALGSFVTPALLGGRRDTMMANLVNFYLRETLNWQLASALAAVLLAVSLLFVLALVRFRGASIFADVGR